MTFAAKQIDRARAIGTAKPRSDSWRTPRWLFDNLNRQIGFNVDVAASAEDALCEKYFDEKDDGPSHSWAGLRVWCNPPYLARPMTRFVDQAIEDRKMFTGVLLLPSKTEQPWFHKLLAHPRDVSLVFSPFRISFEDESGNAISGNTIGSVLACFGDARGSFCAADLRKWRDGR